MPRLNYQKIEKHWSYKRAWEYQSLLQKSIIESKRKQKELADNYLLLCEHMPVFTLGKSGKDSNLVVNESFLASQGIEFHRINRGGDITYHGPGQITAYPILDMDQFYHDVHRYVRDLEEVIIRTLAEYNLLGERHADYTGVWITDHSGSRKICAIGVHMSRWVSMHGFALNVNTNLSHFDLIIPCGIRDEKRSVTSIAKEINREVDYQYVRSLLLNNFCDVFNIQSFELIGTA